VKENAQEILPYTLSRGCSGNENILQDRCRIYGLHYSSKLSIHVVIKGMHSRGMTTSNNANLAVAVVTVMVLEVSKCV